MDNTVNETWINKLVDELVDTKNEVAELKIDQCKSENLFALIYSNLRLDYTGESLRIDNDTAIIEYIKAVYTGDYNLKLTRLKEEREAEIKKLAEAKAKEAKGKEES